MPKTGGTSGLKKRSPKKIRKGRRNRASLRTYDIVLTTRTDFPAALSILKELDCIVQSLGERTPYIRFISGSSLEILERKLRTLSGYKDCNYVLPVNHF